MARISMESIDAKIKKAEETKKMNFHLKQKYVCSFFR